MKYAVFGMAMIAVIAGCKTTASQSEMASTTGTQVVQSESMTPPSGSGTWRFSDQWWSNGRKFCEYMQGRNRFIGTMETNEKCPVEVSSESSGR